MKISDVETVVEGLAGVRRVQRKGLLPEWRFHGRLIARQLDRYHVVIRADFDFRESLLKSDPATFSVPSRYAKHMMVVAEIDKGNAAAIEDALENAWQLQRAAG